GDGLNPRRPHGEEASRVCHRPRRRCHSQCERAWQLTLAYHLTAEPLVETVRSLAQQLRVVIEVADPGIALAAKQPAHHVVDVTVIDAEPPAAGALAELAAALLRGQHPILFPLGQSVLVHDQALIMLLRRDVGAPGADPKPRRRGPSAADQSRRPCGACPMY